VQFFFEIRFARLRCIRSSTRFARNYLIFMKQFAKFSLQRIYATPKYSMKNIKDEKNAVTNKSPSPKSSFKNSLQFTQAHNEMSDKLVWAWNFSRTTSAWTKQTRKLKDFDSFQFTKRYIFENNTRFLFLIFFHFYPSVRSRTPYKHLSLPKQMFNCTHIFLFLSKCSFKDTLHLSLPNVQLYCEILETFYYLDRCEV